MKLGGANQFAAFREAGRGLEGVIRPGWHNFNRPIYYLEIARFKLVGAKYFTAFGGGWEAEEAVRPGGHDFNQSIY